MNILLGKGAKCLIKDKVHVGILLIEQRTRLCCIFGYMYMRTLFFKSYYIHFQFGYTPLDYAELFNYAEISNLIQRKIEEQVRLLES